MQWLNAVLQGMLLGGLYALLAAGLSLMFGVMRIVNLAHGVLAMLAFLAGCTSMGLYKGYAAKPIDVSDRKRAEQDNGGHSSH